MVTLASVIGSIIGAVSVNAITRSAKVLSAESRTSSQWNKAQKRLMKPVCIHDLQDHSRSTFKTERDRSIAHACGVIIHAGVHREKKTENTAA